MSKILLQHELEELLGCPVYGLHCYMQIEALYHTKKVGPYGIGKEKCWQMGEAIKETYEFCTKEVIPIPFKFRVEQQSYNWNRCSYVITRSDRKMFKEWKFCYERD